MSEKETKILIVDDEKGCREMLKIILEVEGYEVSQAENGTQAIDIVQKTSFDVILMDLKLPDMNGIDVTKKIREFNNKVIIIIVTGCPSLDSSIESQKLDVYDYLIKPVPPDKLKRIISEALKEKNLTNI